MAKLFYTMKETTDKLKMSETQVKELVSNGQLQEFRDRDRLMFKVDQVNLLAQGETGGSGIYDLILEPAEPAAEQKELTGISIFDADDLDESPKDDTSIGLGLLDLTKEDDCSGSGLLDLTREADDSSLGRDLLEEVAKHEEEVVRDLKEGRGAVYRHHERPSSALFKSAGRFDEFDGRERELIRRALLTLRTARKDSAKDIEALISELDEGSPPPRKRWFESFFK